MDKKRGQNFLETTTTRRQFLTAAAKGAAVLTVGATLLQLVGCGPAAQDAMGRRTGTPLPSGMLVADSSRCTGCGRCELTCTLTHQGAASTTAAGISINAISSFGADTPKLNFRYGDGLMGSGDIKPNICRQCRAPFCANACPKQAILPDKTTGARTVQPDLCDGCGTCITACPWGNIAIVPQGKLAHKCVTCGACVSACPTGALIIAKWGDIGGLV